MVRIFARKARNPRTLAVTVSRRLPLSHAAIEGVHELQEEPTPLYINFEHRRRLGSSPRRAEGVVKSPRRREPSRNPTRHQGPLGKDPLALRSVLN
jgi:hypothetical protein